MKYQFRRMRVEVWDKHDDLRKRRRGPNVDRYCRIDDSAHEKRVIFPDQDGDDFAAFIDRVSHAFLVYLNAAGADGWQCIDVSTRTGYFSPEDYPHERRGEPTGTYLLMRIEA